MNRAVAFAKLARARVLVAQAERLRAEAEAELLDAEPSGEPPVVTDLDRARVRKKLRGSPE